MPDALRTVLAAALAIPVLASIYVSAFVRARPRLGAATAAALAIPVVASIYASALLGIRAGRVGLIVTAACIAVVGFTAVDRPTGTGAQPPSGDASVAEGRFLAVTVPGSAGPTAEPVAGSSPGVSPGPTPELSTAPVDPTPVPVATPEPPTVVRFRPTGAAQDVDRSADLSVRFSTPMADAASSAFTASIDDQPVAGSLLWAEGNTVLVLDPDAALPFGARVVMRVDAGAASAAGVPLASPRAISFTVESKPTPTPEPTPDSTPAPRPAPDSGSQDSGAASSADWRWPLLGPITQRFGESLTVYGYHYGIDIDGTTGDPVRAARFGRVVVAGHYDACGGNEVHIEHVDGLVSWYRHLSQIEVSVGDQVDAGDLVGRVGNTGCSLGSHLHFAIRRGTTFLDPLRFLPSR